MKPCPYCAEEIQDAAIICRYCRSALDSSGQTPGTPTALAREQIATSMSPPQVALTSSANASDRWTCPECGSDQVQRASVTHAMGTSALHATTRGVIVGGSSLTGLGLGAAGGVMNGTVTTGLAAEIGPPAYASHTPSYLAAGILIGCVAGLLISFALVTPGAAGAGGMMLGTVALCVIGGVVIALNRAGTKNLESRIDADAAREEWQQSCVCLRCHARFQLGG